MCVCVCVCVCVGVIDDVMVVPVGISYDKLIERKFIRHELMVTIIILCDLKCFEYYLNWLNLKLYDDEFAGVCRVAPRRKKISWKLCVEHGLF